MKRPWTIGEHRRLEGMVRRLIPYRRIAEKMGRSVQSVACKARELRVRHGRFDVPPVLAWSPPQRDEDVRLSPSERQIWRQQERSERG